ncbi:LytTR family DNA-binding domain-containing protein [Bifidobacterium sp. SO4]|uniref:LytR/AlgR family response regulator transcription factor n=1 Tax=Bifidobacterium sp. SO4 TaxID=2809030 RepID=UPI001BDCC12B|nr:LytTR family DNA-binding domain-containing protein [Bifidobacterium sp. SO4]MBT1170109.1 response regulator transcription factor [Bifidobacterium sp. SO4]
MIRVAIVEDEPAYAQTLREYLEQYSEEIHERFDVTVFPDGEDIVENYRAEWDIILMDIEMASMDGMTAAERIREVDGQVVIIFITNMAQYAIQGYRVGALDYVLKPISYFAFTQRLGRAISRMQTRSRAEEKYMVIASKTSTVRVPISRILWIESSGHRLAYHTADGVFESTASSMKEVEDKLADESFFRCNKGILVNLAHVRGVEEGSAVIGGGTRIPVSRAKQRDLLTALTAYLGNVIK